MAWRGKYKAGIPVRHSSAWHGKARSGMDRGEVGRGKARCGEARPGSRCGLAGHGEA